MPTAQFVTLRLSQQDLDRLAVIQRGYHCDTKADAIRGLIRRCRINRGKQ